MCAVQACGRQGYAAATKPLAEPARAASLHSCYRVPKSARSGVSCSLATCSRPRLHAAGTPATARNTVGVMDATEPSPRESTCIKAHQACCGAHDDTNSGQQCWQATRARVMVRSGWQSPRVTWQLLTCGGVQQARLLAARNLQEHVILTP